MDTNVHSLPRLDQARNVSCQEKDSKFIGVGTYHNGMHDGFVINIFRLFNKYLFVFTSSKKIIEPKDLSNLYSLSYLHLPYIWLSNHYRMLKYNSNQNTMSDAWRI